VTGWQYDSSTNYTWADFAGSDQFGYLVDLYGGYSTAVGAYADGISWCGCYDMAGNAFEWTSTINTATNGAEAGTSVNVVKGGSWYATSSSGKSTGRGEGRSGTGSYHSVGFRVAARAK
jgi:formylglycine-generating enzyme required for sulfatase activity